MKRILLDTSAYSNLMRGASGIVELLDDADEVFLCAIVLGELLAGFKRGSREQDNKLILRDFLSISNVVVLNIDDSTAERYSIILDYLKKYGTPIPSNDVWIAACAMQNGLVLLTTDQHFSLLPQIVSEIQKGA
ncbi:MAG TPA: type II toxin-antitoxin system VapC family toxin [Desulfuromonadales bacterium]|nr:type II toxin-antitoxin system VapC family toxin [Desulfuromonadales bacterium]